MLRQSPVVEHGSPAVRALKTGQGAMKFVFSAPHWSTSCAGVFFPVVKAARFSPPTPLCVNVPVAARWSAHDWASRANAFDQVSRGTPTPDLYLLWASRTASTSLGV